LLAQNKILANIAVNSKRRKKIYSQCPYTVIGLSYGNDTDVATQNSSLAHLKAGVAYECYVFPPFYQNKMMLYWKQIIYTDSISKYYHERYKHILLYS
jgi:hypothetical protein